MNLKYIYIYIKDQTRCRPRMTISRATNLLYTPPWQPIMHFNWTSSSRHCFSAAEIFHFGLIRIHSNARNSIHSDNLVKIHFMIVMGYAMECNTLDDVSENPDGV